MTEHFPELDIIGNALALALAAARNPSVAAVLGAAYTTELLTTASGFRQRFPDHWPGAQQPLPLPSPHSQGAP